MFIMHVCIGKESKTLGQPSTRGQSVKHCQHVCIGKESKTLDQPSTRGESVKHRKKATNDG